MRAEPTQSFGAADELPVARAENIGAVMHVTPHSLHVALGAGGIDVAATNCDGRSFGANVEVDPATPPPPSGDGEATPANFNASWTKSVGIARVTYSISVEGGASTAVFSDDLSQGTIKPPSPFHGQATIRRQGKGWEWSGSLSARFPGRTVRLTGPGFEPFVRTFKLRSYTLFAFFYSVRC